MLASDVVSDTAVRSEQIRTLYAQSAPLILTNVANATLVCIVLFREAPHGWLLGWLLATALVASLRLYLRARYRAAAPSAEEAPIWGGRFAAGGAAAGALWGGGSWLFFQPGHALSELLITFVLAGNTAAAAGTQSCYMPAFIAYFLGVILPFVARVASPGDPLHLGMAAMICLYGVMLVSVARGTHRTIRDSFRLRFENDELVAKLSDMQGILEQANRDLGARVRASALEIERQGEALQAARAMEAVGRLAAGIAHDFNNVLTVVTLNARDLLARVRSTPEELAALEDVAQAGERGAELVRQLLAFGRKQRLDPRVFDLNDLVREDERLFHRLLGEHIELRFALSSSALPVRVDQVQLRQVLVNLVTNGRDAMPEGGPLLVSTASVVQGDHKDLPPGRYAVLTVRDSGVGMDAQTVGRIFEPFFTTKESGRGTGLGLATVHGIVFQSGGSVEVSSSPGSGTEFRVYLPWSEEKAAVRSTSKHDAVAAGTPSVTVLLAEDDAQVRAILLRALESMGHLVLEADGGRSALALAEKQHHPPALLVTDVLMPGLSGPALFDQLRQRWPTLRVLFISGHVADEHVPDARSQSQIAHLAKPFTPDALREKVNALLATPDEAVSRLVLGPRSEA